MVSVVNTCYFNIFDIKKCLLIININSKKLDLEKLPPSNFVFLIDVSGSMDLPNRLPLLQSAFRMLVNNLRAKDTVSIVVYGGVVGLKLNGISGAEKEKILKAIDELWRYTGEIFEAASYELRAASDGLGVNVSKLKEPWQKKVNDIFSEASLIHPSGGWGATLMQTGGKEGNHSEHLSNILTELQYMQRTYPGCDW